MYNGSEAEALEDVEINCDVVEKKLSTLREDKITGVDGLLLRFLNAVSKDICKWLTLFLGKC